MINKNEIHNLEQNELKALKKEHQERYEALYKLTEKMPGAIYQYRLYIDGTSNFPFVSNSIADLYEVSAKDVLKNPSLFFNNLHPNDVIMAEDSIKKSAESMQEWALEYRVILPKKGLRWLKGKANPEKLDDGSILWHGVILDITEQKEIEEELYLFKRSVESSNEAISITKAGDDEIAIYVNPAFEQLTGYSKKEILGKNLRLLNEANINQPELELIHNAIEKQESIQIELKNYAKDGSEFISQLSIDPVSDDDNITHYIGIQKDITKDRSNLNELKIQSQSVEKSLAGINIVDSNGLFTYVNEEYLRMWGYNDKDEVLGTSPTTHCYDPSIPQKIFNAVDKHNETSIEYQAIRKDGSLFDVLMAVRKILVHEGNELYLASILDISMIKNNERKLRQSATVFENTTEGVMITDVNSIIIDVNEAFTEITGRSHNEVIGKNPSILKSGKHNKKFYSQMWRIIKAKGSWKGEIWNRRKNGEIYPQWLNISSVKNSKAEIENYIAVFSDITSLKETEEKLDFLAHHDHLTQLPNRTLLKARLEHTMSAAKRNKTLTAVLFIDIDNFKNINDSYGHTIGDTVLITVAKRISHIMREDDTLARIGGDEFIIGMNHFKSPEQIAHVAQNIMDLFEESIVIDDKEFWITLSMGISIAPDDGMNTETLIKNADIAMYAAKGNGKKEFKFFNDKMSATSFQRIVFETALRTGISNHEFEVYYQPQEDLINNKIIGFEALVRWHHPTLGMVSPDRFISIAEDTKMILPIGEFVLNQACKDIKKWSVEGLCMGRIAVNVSGVQLEHSNFAEILKHCLSHYELDSSMIEIEVTESMVMKNPERWITILEEIKRMGVSISIDDFGTGYSSLSYLRRLPADTLKIDQSFVQDTPNKNDACAIVNAIINMADSLGLDTLAEGVETVEQRNFLVENGCKYAQGFLLSKPMNGNDTYTWLKKNSGNLD